jgi:hypothetical protein
MALRRRIILALAVAALSGLMCYARLWTRQELAADFTWPWRAARLLAEGQNPYAVIRPEGDYPFQAYFYYPLTAALAAAPFALLPPYLAGALFFGVSSGLLAFALSVDGWKRMGVFLSAPYWVALAVAQWSPLLAAAALLPGLGWLLACKPNVGLAGFVYRPTWAALMGGGIFGILSLLLLPSWPWDWRATLGTLAGHPPAILILPLGPLLLLALLRARAPEGRLLLALSIFPQLLFFYDQLILWLIPASFMAGAIYAALSWAGYFAWRITSIDPASGEILRQPTQFILWAVYLPALVMVVWTPEVKQRLLSWRTTTHGKEE